MASIIKEKSFRFAVKIVELYKILTKRKEFVMSRQLLRSGTSVGANVREAQNAQSTADFIHKLSIAQKEADETLYWMELLLETEYITEEEYLKIYNDCEELLKIIRSIIMTTKKNNS